MKIDKQSLLAITTFILLLMLIGIQFIFLVRAAKLEQKHFNHRVVLALSESRNEIARAANACQYMNNYVCGKQCTKDMATVNSQKADSIIRSNLAIHKINLDYTFEFVNIEKEGNAKSDVSCYEQSLNGLLAQNGIKLLITFPEQSQFIFAQAGTLFYISIAVIVFVMISFVFTSRLFSNQKRILSNTKDFIDNMVHEFQTPVANIKLASSLIKKNINTDFNGEKINNYTHLIQDENNKIKNHVADILRVADMIGSKKEMADVNMHQLIHDCTNIFRETINRAGGSLSLDLKANDCVVRGKKEYLHHALCNLLDNAIKYSRYEPDIKISTINKKKKMYLAISDKGIGIDPENHKNIFEKYFRVTNGNIHDTKGFGLGLDFVKTVVLQHGGRIHINSQLNKGSTFTLVFKVITL
ncbi:two-component system, OmpR family, phosphate regulon sensor histidine kinase PhoR [Saccharicrinis carchari]|uniref:histidine kinase n=1 Tax=Saccharicrinis carchari TaxID=1168039 RepID=A0A521DC75_SACCC|nr:HAMP domain-containing sensor histidine kinase [Saccharicrinis carchari]SMO69404.1 two-component system, OmpR family, phosphate regulon sensor histidine kinase PhoR [Saccharicrinis carchari]